MNKFALTTVAALPGSGGGCVAYQAPEVGKPRKPVRLYTRKPLTALELEEALLNSLGYGKPALTWDEWKAGKR